MTNTTPVQHQSDVKRLAWLPETGTLPFRGRPGQSVYGFIPGRPYRYEIGDLHVNWRGQDGSRRHGIEAVFTVTDDLGREWEFTEHRLAERGSAGRLTLPYLAEWFEIPEVATVRDTHPELHSHYDEALDQVEEQFRLACSRFHGFKPFQREDLPALAIPQGAVLAWQQGLGKTVGALAWALLKQSRKQKEESRNGTLFAVPSGLKLQWIEAASRFGLSLRPLTYATTQPFTIVSYSELVCLWKDCAIRGLEPGLHFHSVVLDEAVRVKETAAQMTQAVSQIQADHWLALTGTPQKNRLQDLFALCEMVCRGSRSPCWHLPPGFHKTARFAQQFLVMEDHIGNCQPIRLLDLWRITSAVVVRRRKLDVPGVVRKIEHRLRVPMDTEQARRYGEVEEDGTGSDNLNALRLAAI